MLEAVFSEMSPFIDEGRTILADEFGTDYGTYFTILSGIASGRTTAGELKAFFDKNPSLRDRKTRLLGLGLADM